MKKTIAIIVTAILTFLFSNCTTESPVAKNTNLQPTESYKNLHYLALGDSYTIGESVCSTCKFPEQLKY